MYRRNDREILMEWCRVEWIIQIRLLILSGWIVLAPFGAPVLALAQTTERVSVNSQGEPANNHDNESSSSTVSIGSDGRFVAFVSPADNLVPDDTNGQSDVFVRDRMLGTTERVSLNSQGQEGNQRSFF